MIHFIDICQFKRSYSPETAKLGFDLCDLDLWPWPFAWTSPLSMVIPPENIMMMQWWQQSEKGVTDRRTDWNIHRAVWLQLKTIGHLFYAASSFVHHFIAISEFKLELQSGNTQFRSKSVIFCFAWPWNFTVDLEKQYGTSSMLLQALCIIS